MNEFSVTPGSFTELLEPLFSDPDPTRKQIAAIVAGGVRLVEVPKWRHIGEHASRPVFRIHVAGTMVTAYCVGDDSTLARAEFEAVQLRVLTLTPALLGHMDETPLDPALLAQIDDEEGTAEDLAQALRETCTEPPVVVDAELRAGNLLLRAFDANSRRVLLKLLAFAVVWTRRGGDRV